jgi:hypothetical protein
MVPKKASGKSYSNFLKPKGHILCLIEVRPKLKILDLLEGDMPLVEV